MNPGPPIKQSIIVSNKKYECAKVFKLLLNYVESYDIPDAIYQDLRLIIEETFINIVSYAHDDESSCDVTIELLKIPDGISIKFTDSGIAFNPITDCINDIEKDDHCEGGMGIHIIKSLTDHLEYRRIDQQNLFTVTKHYTSTP